MKLARVDRSEADQAWERDRIAWNLPRDLRPVRSEPVQEPAGESRELAEIVEETANDG